MNADLFDLQAAGLLAVAVGAVGLMLLVHFELGPAARLGRGGRIALTAALGSGVIAFTIKLGVITTLSTMPGATIDPLIAAKPMPPDPPAEAPPPVRDYLWKALPAEAPAPRHNPTTPEKVALGDRLFHDVRLSADNSLSCASCHDLGAAAGADGRPTARGIGGQVGPRNTPTVVNAAFQGVLFWDGRAPSLEDQAKGPMTNPIEMGMPSLAEVERRVAADPSYRPAFERAFGSAAVTIDRIAQAIASYERTLITPDTPYDRFVAGDAHALSPAQLRGMARFQALGCTTCHSGPNFSGAGAGANALRFFPANESEATRKLGLARGVFRVPSLRNVALTGPWFHNGSVTDLREAVRIMASAQLARTVVPDGATVTPALVWSAQEGVLRETAPAVVRESEIEDIVAFLDALTSDRLAPKRTARR